MPFDLWVYGTHPHILIPQGECVVDPGYWIYTPPPSERRLYRREIPV